MANGTQHQFTMGNIFSQSMDILGKNFWKFCGAVMLAWGALLVLVIPIVMLSFGISALFKNLGANAAYGDLDPVMTYGPMSALIVIAFTTALSFPAASIAYGTVQQLRGEPFSFSQSLSKAFKHLVPAGIATLVWAVAYTAFNGALIVAGVALGQSMATTDITITAIALVLCAVFGAMFFYGRFMVVVPAIVAERLGFVAGLQRSYRLTAGHTFKIWLVGFLLWLVFSVIGAFAGIVPLIGSIAVNVIYTALSAALSAVIYVELRRTKENFGIEEYAAVFD